MRECVARPGYSQRQQSLTSGEGKPGILGVPGKKRPGAAPGPQPQEKYGENNGERVDSSAQEKRQEAGPKNLRTKRRTAGKRNNEVDRPDAPKAPLLR